MTIVLIKEWIDTDVAFFSVLLLLVLGGVINVQEAFSGFSNKGMLTVAFLFIVAGAVQKTGALNWLGDKLLGKGGSISTKLLRLLFPVSGISAFFNNTPIVAILIPVIRHWSKKNSTPLSKLLIPLSYAAILGGMCTLIGTTTNLVIHGMMLENGFEGFSFFSLSRIGIPVAISGVLLISLIGHRLLPERKEPMVELGEKTREFIVTMKVEANCSHIGKSIESAGLRHLKGLYLFQIERENQILAPVSPKEVILKNDRLFFTGLPETILELQKTRGLSVMKNMPFDFADYDSDQLGTFEVVISSDSPLVGQNVRNSQFRSHYDAVIIAIHRSGERIQKKIGDVVLRAGDTLLLVSRKNFMERWYHAREFYLVSKSVEMISKPRKYSYLSLFLLAAMIVVLALQLLPILVAVGLTAMLLIFFRCVTPQDARKSIDWPVLVMIASAFGIARGLENSGLADFLAAQIIALGSPLGTFGIIAGVYILANLYTSIITNNAAAALAFPIALSVVTRTHMEPVPLFITVALAASASFATPIAYQTNLMVYGAGGYRFRDFIKIGVPMNILIGLLTVTFIYLFYF